MASAAVRVLGVFLVGVLWSSAARAELAGSPNLTFTLTPANGVVFEVATAGDTNADGFSDLVVGGGDGIRVFLGHASGLSATPDWQVPTAAFSISETVQSLAVGDVNGDGFGDILAGFPDLGSKGSAYLWLGSADMATRPDGSFASAAWHADADLAPATVADPFFGFSVALVDLDDDLKADIVVGAPNFGPMSGAVVPGVGRVCVWLGTANPAAQPTGVPGATPPAAGAPTWFAFGTISSMQLGQSVGFGDVTGDGFQDLIVGAPGWTGGQNVEGVILVFAGQTNLGSRASGTYTNANVKFEPNVANTLLGASVAGAGDVNGDGYGDVIAAAAGFSPDPGYRLFTGPGLTNIWSVTTPLEGGDMPSATAGDVNGDGLADVIVGRPNGNALDVYFGKVNAAPSTTPSATRTDTHAEFGKSVTSAGDVNGDGFADVAAVSGFSATGTTVQAFHGGGYPTALSAGLVGSGAQASSAYGLSIGTGDWNADGFSDFVAGQPSYDGGQVDEGRILPVEGEPCLPDCLPGLIPPGYQNDVPGSQLGFSVAGAGDVNGDGYDDVIAGAPTWDRFTFFPFPGFTTPDTGAAQIFLGGAGGLNDFASLTIGGDFGDYPQDGQLGWAVAGAGDVNGDGLGDVLVTAPFAANGGIAGAGRVELYLGSSTSTLRTPAAWVRLGTSVGQQLGNHIASVGDLNADGYSDVALTGLNMGPSGEPGALVFLGRPSGLSSTPLVISGETIGASNQGVNVASAGDVNDDGFSDIAYSEPEFNGNQGKVRIYHGTNAGGGGFTGPVATLFGPNTPAFSGTRFGSGIAGGGDVNNDGYGDVVVGAQWHSFFAFADGHAYVYHGGPGGLSSLPASDFGDTVGDTSDYGRDVAVNADYNGDGFSDVLVGAFKTDFPGLADSGAVFLHWGNGAPGPARAPRMRHFVPAGPLALRGISTPTESPGFSANATFRSPEGRAIVRGDLEVKPVGTPFDGTGLVSSPSPVFTGLTGASTFIAGICNATAGCHWRWRVRSGHPYFPRTPWLSPPGNARRELDVRPFLDNDGDGVTSTGDNCPFVSNANQSNQDNDPFGDVCDNCQITASETQADFDVDGAGDACDNCRTVSNPRVAPDPASYLTTNPWATLTGGQRDDDHDGYGNRCDAKFPGTGGLNVGTQDLQQFNASSGKPRTDDICGTTGTRPCAIFDLDESALNIGTGDRGRLNALFGLPPGGVTPAGSGKCPTCPLPCAAGTAGTCGTIP